MISGTHATLLTHQRSPFSDGKLVDASPEIQREMTQELGKLAKQYGGGEGVDMTKFPEFKFQDPKVDPINADTGN
jgi:F-type H+-transporting ATPase subunit 6